MQSFTNVSGQDAAKINGGLFFLIFESHWPFWAEIHDAQPEPWPELSSLHHILLKRTLLPGRVGGERDKMICRISLFEISFVLSHYLTQLLGVAGKYLIPKGHRCPHGAGLAVNTMQGDLSTWIYLAIEVPGLTNIDDMSASRCNIDCFYVRFVAVAGRLDPG
jgi:hypothetical protein